MIVHVRKRRLFYEREKNKDIITRVRKKKSSELLFLFFPIPRHYAMTRQEDGGFEKDRGLLSLPSVSPLKQTPHDANIA